MGRPAKKVDPSVGPAARFAIELRSLREQAGNLPYWKMARRCRGEVSKSALAKAAGGDQIPSERILDAFVGVCGGDLKWWHARREQALDELKAASRPGTQLVLLTRRLSALPPGPSDEKPGSPDGGALRVPAPRRPLAAGDAEDDIIDADIVRDSLLRRMMAFAGRRAPLYLAGIAVLVSGTAVVTATVQDSASTTAASRPHGSVPRRTPTPLTGGGGEGTPTPAPSRTQAAPILPPVVAVPPAASGVPTPAPGIDAGQPRFPRSSPTTTLPRSSGAATVYRVTGADSEGLAIQSQPHTYHVIRYVPNGTALHVVCQTDHGDWVDDRWQYGRHFATWDQLSDGTWVYDWYTTTPRVDRTGYSPGISPCPGG